MNQPKKIMCFGILSTVSVLFFILVNEPPQKVLNEANTMEQNSLFDREFPDSVLIEGIVDDAFLFEVNNVPTGKTNLVIHSKGGISQIALKAAETIAENEYTITIPYLCISACAELLFPAATNINFSDRPLIGYHGNTIGIANYVELETNDKYSYCNSAHSIRVEMFYLRNGIPTGFWQEELKHLEIEKINIVPIENGKCVTADIQTKHTMWYPNSEQLRTIFGLSFSGDVCADSPTCFQEKVSKIYPKGTSVVIGEEIFQVGKT